MRDAGIDEVIVMPAEGEPAAWIERCCAPAVPRLAELVSADESLVSAVTSPTPTVGPVPSSEVGPSTL